VRGAKAFDRSRIEQLTGGAEGIAEVLAGLESAVRGDIDELHSALARGELAAVRSAAHRIKGAALSIGSQRLAATAARVEEATKRDVVEAQDAVEALLEELNRVLEAARG
jgi:HPt (histidine-containing phosphotransfer) domain-containing protein